MVADKKRHAETASTKNGAHGKVKKMNMLGQAMVLAVNRKLGEGTEFTMIFRKKN